MDRTATYELQIDKSGRATCKGRCKKRIDMDEIRFATHSFAPGFEMTQWRHLFCVSDKVWKNALNAHGTVEAIPGFVKLGPEDQGAVREALTEALEVKTKTPKKAAGRKARAAPEPSSEEEEDQEEQEAEAEAEQEEEAEEEAITPPPRGRGKRAAATGATLKEVKTKTPKKAAGRKARATPEPSSEEEEAEEEALTPPPRRRGKRAAAATSPAPKMRATKKAARR